MYICPAVVVVMLVVVDIWDGSVAATMIILIGPGSRSCFGRQGPSIDSCLRPAAVAANRHWQLQLFRVLNKQASSRPVPAHPRPFTPLSCHVVILGTGLQSLEARASTLAYNAII